MNQFSGATGTGIATDATGTKSFKYTGLAAGQVITYSYLDISTNSLTQIASCKDVKTSMKADVKKEAVHGQANKMYVSGSMEGDASFDQLHYNSDFVAAFLGDRVTDSNGNKSWTTKHSAFKKVGSLVGIKFDPTKTTVLYKWFLSGVTPESLDKDFPTDGFYKNSFKVLVDYITEFEVVTV